MDSREKEIREAWKVFNKECPDELSGLGHLLSLINSLRAELSVAQDQLDIETSLHDSMQENLVNQHLEVEGRLQKQLDEIREACKPILAHMAGWEDGDGVPDHGFIGVMMGDLRKLAKLIGKEKP